MARRGRPPMEPDEDGYIVCPGCKERRHLEDYYLRGIVWERWNKEHTFKAWYGKRYISRCKPCLKVERDAKRTQPEVPSAGRNWDDLTWAEQQEEILRLRRAGNEMDLPYERPPEYAVDDADTVEEPEGPPPIIGTDGYEYPADPEDLVNEAVRRFTQGLIDEEELNRLVP